jgi:Mrp family chromosome partitioning ATPase
MEKIQSAIAKARAARAAVQSGEASAPAAPQASGPTPIPSPPPTARGSRTDPAAVAAHWAVLPSFTPAPGLLARGHIVTAVAGKEAVPFDLLRTRLLQQMRANNWRRVAITSPGPACGKSTIALNLAMSLARQSDLRTVLAEMDMRRPSLPRMLGLRTPQSFARVLEGLEPFSTQAIRIGENLAVSTCHAPHPRPAELLHSPTVAVALDRIETEYDPSIFIFDMPPMFVSDDTMAVMGKMDCVLIIAAAESTKIKEIDRCERELAAQTNVLGVVLNKCRYMEDEGGYDYYGG